MPIEKLPSTKSKDAIREFDEWVKSISNFRNRNFTDTRNEVHDFFEGNHHTNKLRKPFKNWLWSKIEGEAPIMLDSRPASTVVPDEDASTDGEIAAEMFGAAIKHVHRLNHTFMKNVEVTKSLLKFGDGWKWYDWDPDINGEGDVSCQVLPWPLVFVDPTANLPHEGSFVGVMLPMHINKAKRLYPSFSDRIRPNRKGLLKVLGLNSGASSGNTMETRDPLMSGKEGAKGILDRFDMEEIVIVEEGYVKDYSMERIPEDETQAQVLQEEAGFVKGNSSPVEPFQDHLEHLRSHAEADRVLLSTVLKLDPDVIDDAFIEDILRRAETEEVGLSIEDLTRLTISRTHQESHEKMIEDNVNESNKRPKYKNNWRQVTKIGELLIYNGAPVVDLGIPPLVPYYCFKDENGPYGTGQGENIIPMQKVINELFDSERQGLHLNSNSGWLIDSNSGVTPQSLTNKQGLVIRKKPGTSVSRLTPAQVSPQFNQTMIREKSDIDEITGQNEFSEGRVPRDPKSGEAVKRLTQNSRGRTRLKIQMFEEFSNTLEGRIILGFITQKYTSERKLRIFDDKGQLITVNFLPQQIPDGQHEVIIAPGTSSELDKLDIWQFGLDLVELGVLDGRELVEFTDPPKKAKLLEMMEAKDQEMLLIQQLTEENQALLAQIQQFQAVTQQPVGLPSQPVGVVPAV